MNRLQAIIFDLEGVVVDSNFLWDKEDIEFLRRRGYKCDLEVLKPLIAGTNLEEGVEITRKLYPFEGNTKELANERRQIFRELLKKEVNFIPGFLGFYNAIKDKYKYAVASSLEKSFLSIIDRKVGLSKLFNPHIYSIEDIGFISKPNPDIFLYAAGNLKVNPAFCVVVEDSPHGVEAAKRAGMKCIGLATSNPGDKLFRADIIVDSYSDIELDKI